MSELLLVLDNIRSCANVGVILRTAKAFGFNKVVMVGTTPTPERKEVKKLALGGEQIPFLHQKTPVTKDWPRPIIAIETGGEKITSNHYRPLTQGTLVLGSERGGISQQLLKECDAVLSINHQTDVIKSLNVSTAFAIAAFALIDTDHQ